MVRQMTAEVLLAYLLQHQHITCTTNIYLCFKHNIYSCEITGQGKILYASPLSDLCIHTTGGGWERGGILGRKKEGIYDGQGLDIKHGS